MEITITKIFTTKINNSEVLILECFCNEIVLYHKDYSQIDEDKEIIKLYDIIKENPYDFGITEFDLDSMFFPKQFAEKIFTKYLAGEFDYVM